ncbi:MAG: thioesterase [Bacteroidales bacterium]
MTDSYKFEKKIKIPSYLVDNQLNLTPTSLLSLMQEVAGEHSNLYNIGWYFLSQYHMFWALIKLHIKIERMPIWNEEILCTTWEKTHDFIIQPRDYEIFDSEGKLLIAATSSWVILDQEHGKPQKIDHFRNIMREQQDIHAIVEKAPKINKIDLPEKERCVFKPVLHSDLDMNDHVNNTKYAQWLVDDMGHLFSQTHLLKELFINYIAQAKCGEYYAIQTEEKAPNNFISSIITQEESREICRLQTIWEEK